VSSFQPNNPNRNYFEGLWLGANDRETEGRFVWAATGQPITYAFWEGANPDNWKEEAKGIFICTTMYYYVLTHNPGVTSTYVYKNDCIFIIFHILDIEKY
jgi:hypothetical protein